MCIMNATRKNSLYSLVDEVRRHNKWKLMCLFMCVRVCKGVCNENKSPINYLKAEGKLEITRLKEKSMRKTFVILR